MKKTLSILLLILMTLTACSSAPKREDSHVKLGMMGSDSKSWQYVIDEVAKEGITLEIVAFSDYPQVNAALNDGEIDLNSFQHQAYLDKENADLGYDIVAIGKTSIAPMGIYSSKLTDIKDVKENDKIAIPNDVTNGGRALQLLAVAGIIELNDAAVPSLKDITANPLNVEIFEMAAANIPGALEDVAVAAINSGIAVDAGFQPAQDSIVFEQVDVTSESPYINIIAANNKDKDREVFKKILDVYYTQAVKDIILKESNGASIPVW